jgi:hypothetical protein
MPSDSPLKRTAAAGQTTHWEQRKKPKKRADSALVENLCIADLRPFMHLTLEQAADELKVGTTVLKRIARKCGIPKWPSRQVRVALPLQWLRFGLCNGEASVR